MVVSKESQNSCHFSVSPLNLLNGNQMLVFSFRMPAFLASALSFSSSISFTFSFILTPFKLLWASNSSFAFSRFSLSSSILSWLRNLSFSISAVSPFISLCFSVPSATDFFSFTPTVFLFLLVPLLSVKLFVAILLVLLWLLFSLLHIVLSVCHFHRSLVVCLRSLLTHY